MHPALFGDGGLAGCTAHRHDSSPGESGEESLDHSGDRPHLTPLPNPTYGKSLQYHTIETDPRQSHSSARSGQEEGRRWPARHKKYAADFRAESPSPTDLGAGA